MQPDLEANKRNAIAFYRTAYLGDPAGAVEAYVGAELPCTPTRPGPAATST